MNARHQDSQGRKLSHFLDWFIKIPFSFAIYNSSLWVAFNLALKSNNDGITWDSLHLEISHLASKRIWFTKRKSFSGSNFPKSISKSEAFSTILASTAIQDNSSFQKKLDVLQEFNKCSRDSCSALQKAHKGESTRGIHLRWYNSAWQRSSQTRRKPGAGDQEAWRAWIDIQRGLTFNAAKCQFSMDKLTFVGMVL